MQWRMKYVVSIPTLSSYAPVSNYDNRKIPWDGGLRWFLSDKTIGLNRLWIIKNNRLAYTSTTLDTRHNVMIQNWSIQDLFTACCMFGVYW